MTVDEPRYLTQEGLKYGCCQLLTAINARRFLDDTPLVELDTPEFEFLVDFTRCRYGSCLGIQKAWRFFGPHTQYGPHCPEWIMGRLAEGRPVGISGWSPDWGLHSSLVVGATHEHGYLVNWEKYKMIAEVPWADITVPWFDLRKAVAFALQG